MSAKHLETFRNNLCSENCLGIHKSSSNESSRRYWVGSGLAAVLFGSCVVGISAADLIVGSNCLHVHPNEERTYRCSATRGASPRLETCSGISFNL